MVGFLISATFWVVVLTRGRRLLQGGAYSDLSGKIAAPIKLVLREYIRFYIIVIAIYCCLKRDNY